MKPIGPLMKEHRTIERMVALLDAELQRIKDGRKADPVLIAAAVDFFRIYADRTHHGKEEDLLFKALEKKPMPPGLKTIMDELVAEHVIARETVRALSDAIDSYSRSANDAVTSIMDNLEKLVELYPKHIEKEDKHFFYPVQDLFDRNEQDAMLQDFWEFDRNMIHEKYIRVVEDMKERLA